MKGKKILALFMSSAMLLSSVPITIASAEETTQTGFSYVQTYADGDIQFKPEGYTILDDGKFIDYPRDGLQAWADSSQPGDGSKPANMIDGNSQTKWEAPWNGTGDTVVTIELPSPAYVYGFVYTTRQDNNLSGIMTNYTVQGSVDGNHQIIKTGTFDKELGTYYVYFDEPVYIKYLQILSDARAIAELIPAYIPATEDFITKALDQAQIITDTIPTGMDNGTWTPDTKGAFDELLAGFKATPIPESEGEKAAMAYKIFTAVNDLLDSQLIFTADLNSKLKICKAASENVLIDQNGERPLTWQQADVDEFRGVIKAVEDSGINEPQVAQKGSVNEAIKNLDEAYEKFLRKQVPPVVNFAGNYSEGKPEDVVDGYYGTRFVVSSSDNVISPDDDTHYIELDYQQGLKFNSVSITSWFSTSQAPTTFKVQYLDENGEWHYTDGGKSYTLQFKDSSNADETQTLTFDETVQGSALRIHVDGGNLSWGKYVIGEIEVGYDFMDVDPDAVTITLNAEDITLEENESFQLEATILPVYVTNKNVTWESDNENITVDETGLVKAGYLADGQPQTGTITATTEFGQKTAVCNITVNPKTIEEEDKADTNKRIEILEKLYTAENTEDYSQGAIGEAKAVTEKAKEDIAKADTLGAISVINENIKAAQKKFEDSNITALRTVKELIDRITGENSSENFILEMIPADPETGMDVYEVDWNAEENKPVLRGNNAVAMATSYNYYLKYFAYLDFPYTGDYDLHLPQELPVVDEKIQIVFPYEYRHYFNGCEYKYTTVNYSVEEWQRRLDWMAMNGFNMFLLYDFNSGEIWHRANQLLGVDVKLSQQAEKEAELAKKVVKMAFDLGLEPEIRPFKGSIQFIFENNYDDYYGPTYKPDFVADLPGTIYDGMYIYTGARWMNQPQGVYISPTTANPDDPKKAEMEEKFYTIAEQYYASLQKVLDYDKYGRTPKFGYVDLVGEQGFVVQHAAFPKEVILPALESCLLEVNPDAIWIQTSWRIQSWTSELYTPGHLMVIDLEAEHSPKWQNTDEFGGTPWLWSMLHNFGGNTGISGGLDTVATAPLNAKKNSNFMSGVSISPEGGDTNPALYGLMAEMTWRSESPDVDQWLEDYAKRRYGVENYEAAKTELDASWDTIHNTAYKEFVYQGPFQTLVTARPQIEGAIARIWGTNNKPYKTQDFFPAWENMLKAAQKMENPTPQFMYDLVDITRQVLADVSGEYYSLITQAYKANDREKVLLYADRMIQLCQDMDDILATNKMFMLETRLEGAKQRGVTQEEKDYAEKIERTFLTIWLEDQPGDNGLEDYCNHHLSGLMTDYYKVRWQLYKEALIEAMDNGYTVDQFKSIQQPKLNQKINEYVVPWTNDHTPYPTEPVGNSVEVSHELIIKYADIFKEVYNYDVDPSLLDKEADKSELIARYNELKDTENVYSVNSYKTFAAALDNAKSVIDNTEATVEDVNNALAQLNSAFENLTYIKGDVNHDGKLSINDATIIQIHLVGKLGEFDFDTETADADNSGDVSINDATIIQQTIVKIFNVDDDGNIVQ